MDTINRFNKVINDEAEFFPSICELMQHSQVKNGRRFLCTMNNVADYCFNSTISNDISYHIIYVPTCPEWARELLVRFFIHKMALTTNNIFVDKAKLKAVEPIFLPMNATKKIHRQLHDEKTFYKKVCKLFNGKVPSNENHSKTLFVVKDKDVVTRKQDKNPWLYQMYENYDSHSHESNILLTTNKSAIDIETKIRNNRDDIPDIKNIIVFHSQNRGRLTCSYNKEQLIRLNQYGVGIRNCIVFYISEQPYRLYHTIDNIKNILSSNLLVREINHFDDYDGFITFTYDEICQMFYESNPNQRYLIDSSERDVFTSDIDTFLDELPHNYKIKDLLSLCITEDTQNQFLKDCKEEIGIDEISILKPFLNFYKQLWTNEIIPKINRLIGDCQSIAFILPKWIAIRYKHALQECFAQEGRSIQFKNFEDLKSGINASLIIMLGYRYTDSRYKSYPNSFDPMPILKYQKGITIVNRLTHNTYFEWNMHFYERNFNGLMYSDFRKERLGWSKGNFQRPTLPGIYDDIVEAESDARDYMPEKCTIIYENGKTKCFSSARALYLNNQRYCIASIKELPSEDELKIQLLDDIVNQVRDSLIRKTTNNLKSEEYIRKDPTYGLTEDQINSQIELWKYLLKRAEDEKGIKTVYNEIFPNVKEISLHGFERWTDFNYPIILPRSRKCQNDLLTYLGFSLGSPYHRVVLTKKLMKNNNTRSLNSQIESFLQSILTSPVLRESDFCELFDEHSEIITLLEIKTTQEIKTLIDLLDIKLRKVKSIKYD